MMKATINLVTPTRRASEGFINNRGGEKERSHSGWFGYPHLLPMPSALLLLAVLALALPAQAVSVILRVVPSNLSDVPVTVRVVDRDFGKRFTVFYRTNEYTLNEFLFARLEVGDEDKQIASCAIDKVWTTNGLEFEFTISGAYLEASKFTLTEVAHSGRVPMPAFSSYWFYLRDFATNNAPPKIESHIVAPEILKDLPARVKALKPGTTSDAVWAQLRLSNENLLGGEGSATRERYWLTWNHEIEFFFELTKGNQSKVNWGQRKLAKAILYKNGREISSSESWKGGR